MIGMIKALKQGGILGLLIDQKLNEGVTVPFFDMNANTGIAFIDMAKKFDCPLVPMRSIRTESGFIMDVCPPIETKNRDTLDILNDVHALLEQWIREYPEQWLWLHRRWKTEELKHV
jgi:KDO2-lipid IV(A) lauroyltransferase